MDTETVSPNFDDIRPLNNSEVKDAIENWSPMRISRQALRYIKPEFELGGILSCHACLQRRRRSLNLLWPMTL